MNLTVILDYSRWLLLLVIVLGLAAIGIIGAYVHTQRHLRRLNDEYTAWLLTYLRELNARLFTERLSDASAQAESEASWVGKIDRLRRRRRLLLAGLVIDLLAGSISLGSYLYSSGREVGFAELPLGTRMNRNLPPEPLTSVLGDTGIFSDITPADSGVIEVRPGTGTLSLQPAPRLGLLNQSRIHDSLTRRDRLLALAEDSRFFGEVVPQVTRNPHGAETVNGGLVPFSHPLGERLSLMASYGDALPAARAIVGRFVGAVHARKSASGLIIGPYRKDLLNFIERLHPTVALREILVERVADESTEFIIFLRFSWHDSTDTEQNRSAKFRTTVYRSRGAWSSFGQLDLLERFPGP